METQERMEREINLKDLFWGVIFGWRQMICFGILFAILVSGMRYFLDVRSYDAQQNVDVEFERGELEEEDARKIADAVEVAARKEGYEKYLDTAAIMQVDPYKKPVVGLQYYVDSDYVINYTKDSKHDYTNDIMAMYANYIKSGEVSQKVIEMAGLSIESEEFSELCSVEQTGSTMTIWITYPKEDKLDTIADAIRTLVSEKEPELQTIGSHTLKELEGYKNTVVDTSLLERKTTIINTIASLDTQLTNAKSAMTPQQLSIYEEDLAKEIGEKEEEEEEAPGFSLKYLILGAFVGIFLVCAWIACRIIFTAKLQNAEEIRSLYGVRLIGEVETPAGRKRFLPVIDDKLLAIKNRRKKKLTLDQQVKVACANAAVSCNQQGLDCVYLTGSEYDGLDKDILGRMKKELSAQGVQVKEGVNMFYDAASLKNGIEVGNILFVEQKNKSIYDEISNEINLVREQGGNILGMVVLA